MAYKQLLADLLHPYHRELTYMRVKRFSCLAFGRMHRSL